MLSQVVASGKKVAQTFLIAVMAVVLLAQSPVSAQSAAMANTAANAEVKALVTKMKKEVDRRIEENKKAIEALEGSNTISGATKKSAEQALTATKKSLEEFKKQIEDVDDLKSAKELAKKIDTQYEQYANSNASAQTLKDGDVQQQSFLQLQTTTTDAKALIGSAETSGKDVTNLKEHVGNLDKLVQSIGAIVASVIALIAALIGGNFTGAATIFQTILGQLSQNLVAISTAQTELAGVVDSLNSFQGLTAGASEVEQ